MQRRLLLAIDSKNVRVLSKVIVEVSLLLRELFAIVYSLKVFWKYFKKYVELVERSRGPIYVMEQLLVIKCVITLIEETSHIVFVTDKGQHH